MKLALYTFISIFSFNTFSQSLDTQTFIYDGSSNSKELILRTEKMRTEYRTEERTSTCYREQILRFKVVCSGYQGGAGQRRAGTGQVCNTIPVYGTVPYTCVETVKIPFEVKDYDVEARVIINVKKASTEMTVGEKFTVTLVGDKLSFDVLGSKKFFIVQKKQDIASRFKGSVKALNALLEVELVEVAPIKKSLNQLGELDLVNDSLNFSMGELANIGFSLKIEKLKLLSKDSVVIDRKLSASEVEVSHSSNFKSNLSINMRNLGLELLDGKFKVSLGAFVKFSDVLMNANQFESLSNSKDIIVRN